MANAKRCNHCFAAKEVSSLFQDSDIACCRSCSFKIKQVLDFLEYHGVSVVVSSTGELPTVATGDGTPGPANTPGDDNPPTPHSEQNVGRGRKKTG